MYKHVHLRYWAALGNSELSPHYFTQVMYVAPQVKYKSGLGIPKLPRSHRDCYFRWSEKF